MNQNISWGIIGTGAIAKTFATGLQHSQTGRLVAVGSRSQATADDFGKQFGITHCHASYEALLSDEDVQAVYISTPHPLHAEWAVKAAEAGKHILCEKPVALNHAETMAIIEACREHRVFFMEAFMYRCHPQTAKLVELLQVGAIGQVRVVQVSFGFYAGFNPNSRLFNNALGGGGILDVGCYTASMARLVAGVAAGKRFADPIEVKGVGHLGETGVDEWAAAVLKFPGEIVAQVSTSVAVNQENVLRIFGSEGRITVPNPWCASRQAGDTGKIIVQKKDEKEPQEILLPSAVTSFAIEADVVGNAILAGTMEAPAPAMSWEDSLGNMRTLDAWRESIGLVYESEKPANYTYTVTRRPLAIRKKHNMKYGRIPGLDKPVSRLVMGVDNQKAITHASVQFDDFFERGGNCFDTAWVYGGGACEKVLGQWVANRKIRKEVIILDKGAHTPYCTPSDLTEQFLQSLQRLQTDYADIYMMHRDNLDVPVGEFIDVLNEHVRAGRMKVFGGSNWSIKRVEEANAYAKAKGLQGFSAISNNFSLARMVSPVWSGCIAASDAESRDWLTNTQLPLMPWSSQARGFFTERAGKHKLDDKELVRCWYSDDNFQRRDRVLEMAKRRGVLPINIALAYVLCQPFPTFPLIGPRTLHELTTSLPGLDVELSPEELRWLNLED